MSLRQCPVRRQPGFPDHALNWPPGKEKSGILRMERSLLIFTHPIPRGGSYESDALVCGIGGDGIFHELCEPAGKDHGPATCRGSCGRSAETGASSGEPG